MFLLLIQISWNNWQEMAWATLDTMIWICQSGLGKLNLLAIPTSK